MNVLHLYKDFFPVLGGIENHIGLLAKRLRAEGVGAQVLVTNTDTHTLHETIDGVPVTKTGRQINVSSAPISLQFFSEVWRQSRQVDLIHLHAPYPPGEMAQLLVGGGKPFVMTYHSDIVRQKVLGTAYAPLLRLVLQRAALITVSNPMYIESSAFLQRVRSQCRIIHYGIEIARFQKTPQVEAGAQTLRRRFAGRPLLLFLGHLRHYKGVDVLVRAMQGVDAHLLVIGSGPMQAAWQQLTRDEGLADRITFLGEIPDQEALAARYAADIFILPSTNRAESLGIVQLEAMACGLPVICTELGTGTSYVNQHGKTGLVVPPNSAEALARAINCLLADPKLRAQMGAAGLRRVQQEFSAEAMVRQTISCYQEALGPSRFSQQM